ncbi:MAG: hypothetical protein GX594_09310 [Pirellulaceae bacterium]|nr:hypothetical protein [Pirellulaceae bacterium]
MNSRSRLFNWCRFSVIAIALAAAGWLLPRSAAGELDKLETSLKLVPEDAAFYAGMMRNREQIEAVAASNAWAKFKEMPVVQMGMMLYGMQLADPDSGPAQLAAMMENPEVKKIIDMLLDMFSEEVFIYGDDTLADLVQLLQDVDGAQNHGALAALFEGEAKEVNRMQIGYAISALAEEADLLGAPNLIAGFKISNRELVKEQLIKLETIGNIVFEASKETKGRFRKTKVGDHDFLVLELDGEMIPWDEVPLETFEQYELNEGDVDAIVERVKESTLVVALGLRGDYLILSIGPSLDYLEELGEGASLIDRKELEPLAEFADRPLTSIGYMSEEMGRRLNNQQAQIDRILALAGQLLPESELSEEQQERILDDAQRMAEELKALVPESGAVFGFSFLAERGIESYRYNWGDHGALDGDGRLGLLRHVGGNPILAFVMRQRPNPDHYDLMARWAKTAYGYFREIALPLMDDDDRVKLEQFLTAAAPLIEQLNKTNREKLIPALADGQAALLLDGKLRSKQFCMEMSPAEKPLPMFEPALVVGLSDAELFHAAMRDYWHVINALIDAMRGIEGSEVPDDFRLPEPAIDEISEGKLFCFPLPEKWGLDKQIVPNMGISDGLAVFAFSRDHSIRLLRATPPAVGGLIDDGERPLALAGWLDWAALVDAASPWVDYFFKVSPAMQNIDDEQREMIADQVRTVLDLLKVLRKISGECYFKDGALVTHTLAELQDVEE